MYNMSTTEDISILVQIREAWKAMSCVFKAQLPSSLMVQDVHVMVDGTRNGYIPRKYKNNDGIQTLYYGEPSNAGLVSMHVEIELVASEIYEQYGESLASKTFWQSMYNKLDSAPTADVGKVIEEIRQELRLVEDRDETYASRGSLLAYMANQIDLYPASFN